MKSFRLLYALLLMAFMCTSSNLMANVFASNIRITQQGTQGPFDGRFSDGTGVAIRFVLSDHADSVVAVIKDGATVIRTFTTTDLSIGDTSVVWDGKDDNGVFVSPGAYNYSISLATYDKGYATYTPISQPDGTGLSQRGMTTINNPSLKSFGFVFTVDNGFQSIAGPARWAANLEPWGDVKDQAKMSFTGLTAMGSNDIRWGVQSDEDGYIYVMARAGSATAAKGVYRFHPDTMNAVIVDSAYGAYYPFGIAVKKDGATKTFAVVTLGAASSTMSGDSRILTYHVDNDAPYFGSKDTLLKGNGKVIYWDIVWGRDSTFYVPIMFPGDTIKGGVAKFDLHGKTLPLTLADTVWTARVDTGRPVTVSLYQGSASDGSNDVLYLENSKTATGMVGQGVWGFTGLNTSSPTRVSVFPGTASSTTRTDVSVDAVGNIVYFENSGETMALISPPTGPNNFTTNSSFNLNVVNSISISAAIIDANNDFIPDKLNDTVTVAGIVNSRNMQTSNTAFTFQDDSAGTMYFSFGLGGPALKIGDMILLTGVVKQNRGTTEIIPASFSDVKVLDSNLTLSPIVLTINQYLAEPEKYENRLVKVTGLGKKPTSLAWPAAGASANMMFWNGWDSLMVRIDSDTPIDGSTEPTYPVDVMGIGGQYTSAALVYNDGYEIIPNDSTDFTWNVSVAPNPHFALVTPANGSQLKIDSLAQTFKFTWNKALDLNGDNLIYQWLPVGGSAVTTGGSGVDSFLVRTGTQLLALMAGKDTSVLKWSVRTKDPAHPIVANVDTVSVTLIKGSGILGVVASDLLPTEFAMAQNYPNPFNPSTTIQYSIARESQVSLIVYNMLGQEVGTLVNEKQAQGNYTKVFDASHLASGMYVYRIQAGNYISVKKMMLLK
jgi:DNA/RNA endonuclease YhcR with UshA esterase domain